MFKAASLVFALAALPPLMTAAPALADPVAKRHRNLPVVVGDPPGVPEFGSLTRFLVALQKAGHTCNYASGERSASIACDPATPGPLNTPERIRSSRVFISIDFVPTRAPDYAQIGGIRAAGVDAPELAKDEIAGFVQRYLLRR
ncbi:MAG TPA: hypothetical protein PKW21_01030 [Rhabdaerophilum sp.]|nr:hypothetical protein [Rhabdaerophilum sp.]